MNVCVCACVYACAFPSAYKQWCFETEESQGQQRALLKHDKVRGKKDMLKIKFTF